MLEDYLLHLLGQYQPERLIVAGAAAAEAGNRWSQSQTVDLADITEAPLALLSGYVEPADLALVTGILDELSHEDGRQLLGELRNRSARRIAVCIDESGSWSFNDLIGLAFRRYAQLDNGLSLYCYDIETYNPARAWNNPDNWANPEMWGKYRW